jgi:phenylpropionate dioxygenase-like ring-hydroxylating dioxygenase large terminal subunit
LNPTSYDRLVDDERGLIDRNIYVNPDIYQAELEAVFTRAWLFIGHESMIPNAGDFFTSRMGEESVILTRDRDQKIHAFLNTCRHRGMKVCRYDQGNTPLFTCPYHAWSYSLDGKLAGVPMYNKLYEGLDRSEWSLIEVAQLCNYKGAIWATWDPKAPPFLDYLGDMKAHLDTVLDARDGQEGGSEVLGGIQKFVIPANWKFGAENIIGDSYHNVSHRSVDLTGIGPSSRSGAKGRRDGDGSQHIWISFPQGHGAHSAIYPEANEYIEQFRDSAVVEEWFRAAFEARKRLHGDKSRMTARTGTVFPHASYHGQQPRDIVVWHPHGPTTTEIWRFYLVDKVAPQEVKDFLRHYYMRYLGPAGMTEQDDVENWNYATAASRGTVAKRYPYNYQQSIRASSLDGPLPGKSALQVTEGNARGFYRRWRMYMNGGDWDALMGRNDPLYHAESMT